MRRLTESRGSILIWTLLLGISLATVFFFFSMRLNANIYSQRETIKYQNARLYFESYIAYIQSQGVAELNGIRGNIDFDGITGTLTNEVEEIVGRLDMAADVTYEVEEIDGFKAKIEWNKCGEKGVMEITPAPATPLITTNCGSGSYDGLSESNGSPFTLKNLSEPFTYMITPQGKAIIYDREWHLDLELVINFRKKLTTSLTFIPN